MQFLGFSPVHGQTKNHCRPPKGCRLVVRVMRFSRWFFAAALITRSKSTALWVDFLHLQDLEQPRPQEAPLGMVKLRLVKNE